MEEGKTIKANIDLGQLKEAQETIQHIHDLLKEANSLAGELASNPINLEVDVDF